MKVVLLAGGFGTRLSEVTQDIPKPMVEIGGRPIVWHIMKHYAKHGHREFFLALGYKGVAFKSYFLNYRSTAAPHVTVRLGSGDVSVNGNHDEDWTVHLIDTGLKTITGGRLKRMKEHVRDGTFLLTYGDGVSNVDLTRLVEFHRSHGKLATITAVRPPARFGGLTLDRDRVQEFTEKPLAGEGWINGGFFVLEPKVLDYIEGDATHLEREPLERLAREGQLMAYKHPDFWQCMDTMRDLHLLNSLWESGEAPWATWRR